MQSTGSQGRAESSTGVWPAAWTPSSATFHLQQQPQEQTHHLEALI